MSYLLDTHTLAWWLFQPHLVSAETAEIIGDSNQVIFVSAISAFEMSNKYRLGKWPAIRQLAQSFEQTVEGQGFRLLAISCEDAALAGRLESPHRDPFDRMLASQSRRGPLILLTKDPKLSELGAITFW